MHYDEMPHISGSCSRVIRPKGTVSRGILAATFLLAMAGISSPAESDEPTGRAIKCGTPEVLEILSARGKIASARRDYLKASALSSGGNFRVHYDPTGFHAPDADDANANGIPDFVDSTMVYLEYARELLVDQMGFRPPRGDNGAGGGDEIDIYIKNFESDLYVYYALTYPDQESGGVSSAYIVIDNDYREEEYESHGYEALKVTTAHEFFHVIHFAYRSDYTNIIWWMEQTATWMEDRAWDSVDDYFLYLGDFLNNVTVLPLTTSSSHTAPFFMYGAALWPAYLAKTHGDQVIRDGWEAYSTARYPSLLTLDPVIPGGLGAALNEFGVWNYFTGGRAPTDDFYPDGPRFGHTVGLDFSADVYPSEGFLAPVYSTSNYAEFLFAGDWKGTDRLRATFTPYGGRVHQNSLIFFNNSADYRIEKLTGSDSSLTLGKPWNRAVLVSTNVDSARVTGSYHLRVDHDMSAEAGDRPIAAFAVRGASPNPFNPATTIRFTLPARGLVTVRAYDVLGRKAADLFRGDLSAGEKQILWKPGDLAGGVYLVQVSTPFGSQTTKVLLLK